MGKLTENVKTLALSTSIAYAVLTVFFFIRMCRGITYLGLVTTGWCNAFVLIGLLAITVMPFLGLVKPFIAGGYALILVTDLYYWFHLAGYGLTLATFIFKTIVDVIMIVLAVVDLSKFKDIMKKLFFVPAVLFLIGSFIDWMRLEAFSYFNGIVEDIFFILIEMAAMSLMALLFITLYDEKLDQNDIVGKIKGSVSSVASKTSSEKKSAEPKTNIDPEKVKVLKAYKELVDEGIMSQEEFLEKRKELLGR